MTTLKITLEDEIAELLAALGQSGEAVAVELIVYELCRRGQISSGKAAELLSLPKAEFMRAAALHGVFNMDIDSLEFDHELKNSRLI